MIEAVVVGRVGVDLTPAAPSTSLARGESFPRAVGGFAGNIGTGLARLGIATAVVSAVGDDGHGDHVRTFLAEEGIDVSAIAPIAGSRTQVAFFEVWPPDRFPVTFYRSAPAPETRLSATHLPADILAAPVVVLSGALLATEPARSTVFAILEGRQRSRDREAVFITLFDLDWRPTMWEDPAEAPSLTERAARMSDIVVGSDEEFAATRMRPRIDAGTEPASIVLKHGPAGVSLVTENRQRTIPGIDVDVLCGTGAGDALTAAFVAGLLRGLDPLVAVERGNAAGAVVATRLMCSTAMPTPDEIDRMLESRSVEPQGARP